MKEVQRIASSEGPPWRYEKRDRISELDGLRAISILLVLAAHLLPLGPKFLKLNDAAGAMGMSLFFSLSGFLIASRLLNSPKILDFLVRRGTRILPLFYIYILLVFVFVNHDTWQLFWSAAFVVNYNTQYLTVFNAHLWSLCVEMQFYAAMAIAVAILGSRGVWLVWPACLLVTVFRIEAGAYINIATHLRVDEILAGACVACVVHKFGDRIQSTSNRAMPLALLVWFLCSLPQTCAIQYFRPYSSAMVLAVAIYSRPSWIKALLQSRPARYVAEISYALYIIHPATALGGMNEGSVVERYLLKRPISFLATFFLAHVSTFYWEKFWTTRAKTWLERRKSAPIATQ
jgi:peptidoglycan/LPS O-acetylase OafA/YrhL